MFHPVKYPKHYAGDGKVSCMMALKSMMHDVKLSPTVIYWWGCSLKYLWRWPWKNGVQDIEKAIQCMQYMKGELEDEG